MGRSLKKILKSDWLSIITSLAIFIFGFIGGKLWEARLNQQFSNETQATMTGLFTIGLLTVCSLIVISAYNRRTQKREKQWHQTICEFKQQIGTPAELFFERLESSEGRYYRRLVELILQVSYGDEILIMTSNKLKKSSNQDEKPDAHRQSREKYFDTLLEKAKEPGIAYKRIIGFEEGPEAGMIRSPRLRSSLVEHCGKMLEVRKNNLHKVSLRKSQSILDSDILIIGKKVAAISLDIYDPETDTSQTSATIIFHNPPSGQILDQLRGWFYQNYDHSVWVKKVPE